LTAVGPSSDARITGPADRPARNVTLSGSPPLNSPSLLGKTLGSYQLRSVLGSGGMGTVYLAEQPRIGKQVAIKVLREDLAKNAVAVERFFLEARLVNQIRSEHIVDVLDFHQEHGGLHYLIMELLEGESLRTRMLRSGHLTELEARLIGHQVAKGLAAAHAVKVVHRDLKPDNIFLIQRGEQPDFVKLLDFGVANSAGNPGLTEYGLIIGTPLYMAPEQIEARPTTFAADVYSLGCILFEMVAGVPPFERGNDLSAVMRAHLVSEPPALGTMATVSPEYAALVHRCLAKKPEQRFASTAELAAALAGGASVRPSVTDTLQGYPSPAPGGAAEVSATARLTPADPQRADVLGWMPPASVARTLTPPPAQTPAPSGEWEGPRTARRGFWVVAVSVAAIAAALGGWLSLRVGRSSQQAISVPLAAPAASADAGPGAAAVDAGALAARAAGAGADAGAAAADAGAAATADAGSPASAAPDAGVAADASAAADAGTSEAKGRRGKSGNKKSAASASGSGSGAAKADKPALRPEDEAKLARLKEWCARGVFSAAECRAKRAQILGRRQ
jgi:serine/threonine protein kinase